MSLSISIDKVSTMNETTLVKCMLLRNISQENFPQFGKNTRGIDSKLL
jgi:hypothetical protein